eukprot:TRINITY_DN3371_c0_g1_i3.p1 TRINITY_DN3371_c0_g1~~TRINITY_DN3371_c0_g1_i3.p1  ORF type:complete len:542 (+),score=113.67 TRINITY_DN3371_c0_g1_i3:225-1850(+)
MDDMLECPICHDIFDVVVEIPCCHQCFCRACIESWIGRQHTCPGCRSAASVSALAPNYPLQRLVDKVEVECDNSVHGCKAKVGRGELKRHLELCDFALVPCACFAAVATEQAGREDVGATSAARADDQSAPANDTNGPVTGEEGDAVPDPCPSRPREQQRQHERDECPFRLVPCPNSECGATVRAHLLPCHRRVTCQYEPIACSLCGQSTTRASERVHLTDQCPLSEVPCPYAHWGCACEPMPRPQLSSHLTEMAVEHTHLMTRALRRQEEERCSVSRTEMDALHEQVRELTHALAALSALKPHLPHSPLAHRYCVLPSGMRAVKSELVKIVNHADHSEVEYSQPFIRIFSRSSSQPARAEMVFANRCVPQLLEGLFYFEVTIANAGVSGAIGIGLSSLSPANRSSNPPTMPGWDDASCGYHGDDGKKFGPACVGQGEGYGPVFGAQDTVGCGLVLASGDVFFTKNNLLVGTAFRGFSRHAELFPVVGLHSGGAKVHVNFGAHPFRYRLDLHGSGTDAAGGEAGGGMGEAAQPQAPPSPSP